MKKITSLLVVLALLCAMIPAVMAEGVTAPGELPIVANPIKLTVGISPDDGVTDYDTNYYTQYIKEKTGIELEFYFFPSEESEAMQKLELMVAAEEKLPDILLNMEAMSDSAKAVYGRQGVFLPLNDYFEKYGYFWKQSYDKYCTDAEKELISTLSKSPDGNMYGFPFYDVDPTDAQVETLYINKVWCEKLGLPIPTTTDELYEVLCAFRDKDPNGNGKQDEIPLVGYNSVDVRGDLIFILANSFLYYNWSSYGRFNVDKGVLSAGYVTEDFREALRYLHKLYEEKLLAPVSFTQDAAQLKAMMDLPDGNDTVIGCVAVHPWSGSQGFTWTKDNYSKLKEYTAIGPLKGPQGIAWSPYHVNGLAFNSFITKDCKNPEAAFRLMDFMSSELTSLISRRGEQGVDWDYVPADSGKKSMFAGLGYQPIYQVNNDVWAQPDQNKIFAVEVHFLPAGLYAGVTEPDYTTDIAKIRNDLFMDGFYRRYGQYPSEIVTTLAYTAEEMEEVNEISTIIKTYTDEARVLFVTGDMNLDKDWDSYIKTVGSMGLEKWLQVAQKVYDRMHGK